MEDKHFSKLLELLKEASLDNVRAIGDNISANFKDGILSVSVPKIEPEKPKRHTVKIA